MNSMQEIPSLDLELIRKDFPILQRTVREGNPLIYLDNGATTQKPLPVLDAEREFYLLHNAAAHRGAHLIAEEATELFESAREKVARFIGAHSNEVIFTKSATESLNLLAYSWGNSRRGTPSERFIIGEGDRILVSEMEHHANLIPWQQLARRTGAVLDWLTVDQDGRLDLSNLESLITSRTKVVAITHQSNVLGSITSLEPIVARSRQVGALVVLDACQSVPHQAIDVARLDVDFLTFSGHKVLAPTGVGILWGRSELLDAMEPFLTGGSMIESVTMSDATFLPAPQRFEAGVPNMAQAIGLGAAIDYLDAIGMDRITHHESILSQRVLDGVAEIPGIHLCGPQENVARGATFSFVVDGVHPHDVGQYLDSHGLAVRTGHHCAWPLMRKFGLSGTTRASFYLYNTVEEVDALLTTMADVRRYFRV